MLKNFSLRHLNGEKILLFCVLFLTPSLKGFAAGQVIVETAEVQLLHVTTDAFETSADIRLILDADRNIVSALQVKSTGERLEVRMDQLPRGVTLFQDQGYDTVSVYSKDMRADQGGELRIIYLSDAMANGMKGSYKTLSLQLLRKGALWKVEVDDRGGRREIHEMFLKAKRFMGNVIGIQKIVMN